MAKKIMIMLVVLLTAGGVFFGVKRFQILKLQEQEALELREKLSQKLEELGKVQEVFDKQEAPLIKQLEETKDEDTSRKIQQQLSVMLLRHHQALNQERAKLGILPHRIRYVINASGVLEAEEVPEHPQHSRPRHHRKSAQQQPTKQ